MVVLVGVGGTVVPDVLTIVVSAEAVGFVEFTVWVFALAVAVAEFLHDTKADADSDEHGEPKNVVDCAFIVGELDFCSEMLSVSLSPPYIHSILQHKVVGAKQTKNQKNIK